jgi:putative transposase
MCDAYHVTRGGYYAWRKRAVSHHAIEDAALLREIQAVFARSRGTYGSPRVWGALRLRGIQVGEKRVARLMREYGLKARSEKIYRKMPGTKRFRTDIPNRERKHIALLPNQIWVGDVTYLRKGDEWRFLAVVMDKCSRRVLGWALGKQRDVQLTLRALNRAVQSRCPEPGLIFHSDRGLEYAGFAFRKRLRALGFVQSMNRPLRMNDNAYMESFFHSMKSDEYHQKKFLTDRSLRTMISAYVPYYNEERLHSGLGFLSPVQYEQQLW